MILRELISALPGATASGPVDIDIAGLTADSREVSASSGFAAIRGVDADGHRFIPNAIESGASLIISEQAPPEDLKPEIAWLHVSDSRAALATLASAYHRNPSGDMAMAGVTGTNGKTTTSFLIHHIMKNVWHRAGLLGTILVDDGSGTSRASHTTPGPVALSELLAVMRDNGCRGVAMEVSSHGIHQKRVFATGFDACVFGNLTQDHLDYHGSMEAYFDAKASWFHYLATNRRGKKPTVVINTDDKFGLSLAASLEGKLPVITFGFNIHADFRVNGFRQSSRGMEFELMAKGRNYLVRAPLIGRFNVHNIVAAIAAANACGIRPREAVSAIARAPRFQAGWRTSAMPVARRCLSIMPTRRMHWRMPAGRSKS